MPDALLSDALAGETGTLKILESPSPEVLNFSTENDVRSGKLEEVFEPAVSQTTSQRILETAGGCSGARLCQGATEVEVEQSFTDSENLCADLFRPT